MVFSTDENARQTFQADVMASPINPHGHVGLDRSECFFQVHALSLFLIIANGMPLLYGIRNTMNHRECTNYATFSYSLIESVHVPALFFLSS